MGFLSAKKENRGRTLGWKPETLPWEMVPPLGMTLTSLGGSKRSEEVTAVVFSDRFCQILLSPLMDSRICHCVIDVEC